MRLVAVVFAVSPLGQAGSIVNTLLSGPGTTLSNTESLLFVAMNTGPITLDVSFDQNISSGACSAVDPALIYNCGGFVNDSVSIAPVLFPLSTMAIIQLSFSFTTYSDTADGVFVGCGSIGVTSNTPACSIVLSAGTYWLTFADNDQITALSNSVVGPGPESMTATITGDVAAVPEPRMMPVYIASLGVVLLLLGRRLGRHNSSRAR